MLVPISHIVPPPNQPLLSDCCRHFSHVLFNSYFMKHLQSLYQQDMLMADSLADYQTNLHVVSLDNGSSESIPHPAD